MPVKGKRIVEWVEKELPPLSWGVISMKMMKGFMAESISPRNIDETTTFSDNLTLDLKKMIAEQYKKELPAFQ